MVKPDSWIKQMSLDHRMIEPFVEEQVRQGCISFGPSSYGYDIRLADEFQLFGVASFCHSERSQPKADEVKNLKDEILRFAQNDNKNSFFLDPKNVNPQCFAPVKANHCIIPANSFILARSLEYFRIPRSVLALCFGKSSYARCGILVNVTPSEPEWEGYLTISISNTAPVPVKIYANEGIAQLIFLESDFPCEISYADKKGKYQKQIAITPSRVDS